MYLPDYLYSSISDHYRRQYNSHYSDNQKSIYLYFSQMVYLGVSSITQAGQFITNERLRDHENSYEMLISAIHAQI